MKYRYLIFHIIILSFFQILSAQHPEPTVDKPSNLLDIFTKGHLNGHFRNYIMGTLNDGELKDYYADALGGAIRYETAEFHGFHLGVAGIFTYKTFSSDLNEPDPITGEISKWEHELFDILDFDNFNDLDRLEELYIQYRFSQGTVTFGKLEVEDTPLLNRSDGRMKPFVFKGLWLNYTLDNTQIFRLAWLDRISPRSTVEWFDFNEGIGLVDNGYQPDGSLADYRDHLESKGLAFLGYHKQIGDLNLNFYQWYIHNLGYTGWMEMEYNKKQWAMGLQYTLQFPDSFQKELEYERRYVQPGENGQVLSGRVTWTGGTWEMKAAYSRALASGRFLFPRELGRDHFYTSLSRSRLEGFGDTDVLTFMADYKLPNQDLIAGLALTEVWGPERDAFQFNKYNLDSYWQLNSHLEYQFRNFLEGLRLNLLYIYKQNREEDSPEAIFNRSNYHQFNLVANFDF